MAKGAKRKTKHTEDSKPDSEPTATGSSQENGNQIIKAPPKPKRVKTTKPQSEPEYFEDKRNLVCSSTFNYAVNVLLCYNLCLFQN